MKKWLQQTGFTLIEVMTVVAIVGILASIVTVSITGVQTSARNATRVQQAQQLYDASQILANDLGLSDVSALLNGAPPNYQPTCLGQGFTDTNSDGKGDCAKNGSTVIASENSGLLDQLKKVAQLPSVKDIAPIVNGAASYQGPTLALANIDAGSLQLILEYKLEREKENCKLSPVVYFNGSTYSSSQTGSPSYSAYGNGYTSCILRVL